MEHLALRPIHAKIGAMYSNDTKDQFLEMRAKGTSLSRIATDLHVSQRTLVGWNRQLAPDIRALRAIDLEALGEQTPAISSLRSWRLPAGAAAEPGLCVSIAHDRLEEETPQATNTL